VEAVTRPLKVEAFIVCSAWRRRQVSNTVATNGSGTCSVNMY
jgi:hypothetical protein